MSGPLRIAVVGSGVAGLTAAYILNRAHDVTLFEKDDRLGGHAHTHEVPTADGRVIGLDTGFIVHNELTYPSLMRVFRELRVPTHDGDMSFSVRCEGCGLEYSGARGLHGLVPRARTVRPAYLRMLAEIRAFHRHGIAILTDPGAARLTLGAFLHAGGYSRYFRQHFILPLTAAIWSSSPRGMLDFPARYLLRFFANHGLLRVFRTMQWRTVTGGSRIYVDRLADTLRGSIRIGAPVTSVARDPDGVVVGEAGGREHRFDRVVIAAHPDQALSMLDDPSDDEQRLLGAFRYSVNDTVLHTDASVLPRAAAARASWNYLLDTCSSGQTSVHSTYHLNRLQALDEPVDYCVTLNQTARIRPGSELARMTYEHPIYTLEALDAQRELHRLQGRRHTVFCGAYQGWGFHEDGCASGVRAAAALGTEWT